MMAKRTLWTWLFDLMSKPEPRQPMAVRNRPVCDSAFIGTLGTVPPTEDEWNELCSRSPSYYDGMRAMTDAELQERAGRLGAGLQNQNQNGRGPTFGSPRHDAPLGQRKWEPGIEHSQPHPVKENPDGTLYYKGKVYRMVGDRAIRNKNKRRQG